MTPKKRIIRNQFRLTILLEREQADRWKDAAAARGITVSELVRTAVERDIKKPPDTAARGVGA